MVGPAERRRCVTVRSDARIAVKRRVIAISVAAAPQIACPTQFCVEIRAAHPKKKTAIPDSATAGQK